MTGAGLPASFPGCSLGITGVAAAQASMDGTACYALGQVGQQSWQLSGSTVTVYFTGGQEGRQAALDATCDASTSGVLVARGETAPGALIYEFDMRTCAACPGTNPCSTPPPPPSPPPPPPPPGPPGPSTGCAAPNVSAATCVCNGTLYNLSNFRTADGSTFFSGVTGTYRYYLNMLGGLQPKFSGCTFPPSQASGNAAGQSTLDQDTCYPIGLVAQQTWTVLPSQSATPQTVVVAFSGGDEGRQSVLRLACNPTVSAASFTPRGETAPGSLIYEFDAESCAACPGVSPCKALPPPPPPPPPHNACKAGVTSEPWGNLFGGIQGFGQGPMATPATCGLQYRVYAYQGISGPAVGHDDFVYTGTSNGVLLTQHARPVQLFRLEGGAIVSNIALLDGAFYVVTSNQTGSFLHAHTLDGPGADTVVPLTAVAATGQVTVLANPSTTAVYVFLSGTVYHVAFGRVQSTFALAGSLHACLGLNRDASALVVATPTTVYGLDPLSTTAKWQLALGSTSCPLLFDSMAVVPNASGFTLVDLTVGVVSTAVVGPQACVGQAVFLSNCWLVCPTASTDLSAFDAETHSFKWALHMAGPIVDVVADNSTSIIALVGDVAGQTLTLSSVDATSGAVVWKTRFPGKSGSIALDKHGGIIVLTLGIAQSYVYGFGPHGEGSPCPA